MFKIFQIFKEINNWLLHTSILWLILRALSSFLGLYLQGTPNSWSRSGAVGITCGGFLGRAGTPPNTSTSCCHTVGHSWKKIDNKSSKLITREIGLWVIYSIFWRGGGGGVSSLGINQLMEKQELQTQHLINTWTGELGAEDKRLLKQRVLQRRWGMCWVKAEGPAHNKMAGFEEIQDIAGIAGASPGLFQFLPHLLQVVSE